MEVEAINFETAGFMGKGKEMEEFCLEQEKREGDGKADNYRVRRMFPFRIQKMLGDLGKNDGSRNKHAEMEILTVGMMD